ncbi:allophanate hydrolase [Nocardioides immobilis]|uniref:Allophanate hydrolase n=1 Tax=Nocardioides immobilis TaxID=2049295 RepID=A0A417XS76_9ACTN|nr:allophanate hydrolase [Nocardioides immobilis]RHW22414.1 allophanate hydrolase [Nocardioides immobilis]
MNTSRVAAAYAAIAAADRPEVWIDLRPQPSVEAEHKRHLAADGPLSGLLVAVKNNIDVEGFPTTAACPAYATTPAAADARAVARLKSAGATVLGTTNLDQFATGLVGQRSPYGGVRDARRITHISGGSSSGSAVAVALGLVDIAVGTDTAGSGRVPAAFQGVWGIKPTLGVVSTEGVVPACRSFDAVTILARDPATAAKAMGAIAGGPDTRPWPADTPLAAPTNARVAIPDVLEGMAPGWSEAFHAAADRLRDAGCVVEAVPLETFLAAARLLYDGALVAERHAAVGAFVDSHPEQVDPTVGPIITRAGQISASDFVRDRAKLEALRTTSLALLDGFDALLVPTAPGHPTRAEVEAEPVAVNSWLGTWTNFGNLFDMCAVAAPAGTIDEGAAGVAQFGVTVLALAFHDAVALDIAERVAVVTEPVVYPGATLGLSRPSSPWPVTAGARSTRLLVVGAHLRGQPLEHELTSRGARWVGTTRTAAAYRLFALDTTTPAKPGMVRVAPERGGASIEGDLWELSPAALGGFLAELPAPMNLGSIELADGSWATGFGCSEHIATSGPDITAHGGWRAYLTSNGR